jgi:hypothetical protein
MKIAWRCDISSDVASGLVEVGFLIPNRGGGCEFIRTFNRRCANEFAPAA